MYKSLMGKTRKKRERQKQNKQHLRQSLKRMAKQYSNDIIEEDKETELIVKVSGEMTDYLRDTKEKLLTKLFYGRKELNHKKAAEAMEELKLIDEEIIYHLQLKYSIKSDSCCERV